MGKHSWKSWKKRWTGAHTSWKDWKKRVKQHLLQTRRLKKGTNPKEERHELGEQAVVAAQLKNADKSGHALAVKRMTHLNGSTQKKQEDQRHKNQKDHREHREHRHDSHGDRRAHHDHAKDRDHHDKRRDDDDDHE